MPGNLDRCVISGAGPDLSLERAEPLTHRQSPPFEGIPVDVDVKTLGYGVGRAGNAVVYERRLRNEQIVLEYSQRMSTDGGLFFYVRLESLSCLQSRPGETGLAEEVLGDTLTWLDPKKLSFHWDGGPGPIRLTIEEDRSVLRVHA